MSSRRQLTKIAAIGTLCVALFALSAAAGVLIAHDSLTAKFVLLGPLGARASSNLTGAPRVEQTTWSVVPSQLRDANDWLVFSCPQVHFCIGAGSAFNGSGYTVVSRDRRATWKSSAPNGYGMVPRFDDVGCQRVNLCLGLLDVFGPITLARSSDQGRDWTNVAAPANFHALGLHATQLSCSRSFCLVFGALQSGKIPPNSYVAAVTRDGGNSWTPSSIPANVTNIEALSCAGSGRCFVVYNTVSHEYVDFAYSDDFGQHWTRVHSPYGSPAPGHLSCPNSLVCYYLGNSLNETVDGGLSWTQNIIPQLTTDYNGRINAQSLSCATASTCVVLGHYRFQQVAFVDHL